MMNVNYFGSRVGLSILLLTMACSTRLDAGLVVGDVAVLGVHSDNPDEFAWVPLVPLPAGQELFFTDSGWINGNFSGGSGASSDGGLRFVVPVGGISAGEVVIADSATLSSQYTGLSDPLLGPGFSLATFGDQLAVFTGSPASPTFLYAVNTAADAWGLPGGSSSTNIRSDLYPGLTSGLTCVAVGAGPLAGDEYDNARYVGPTSGTRGQLLAGISDIANWQRSDTRFADLNQGVTSFNVDDGSIEPVPEPASAFVWIVVTAVVAVSAFRCRSSAGPDLPVAPCGH